jgi:diguanylate cyclase (GGDEF)-like protein
MNRNLKPEVQPTAQSVMEPAPVDDKTIAVAQSSERLRQTLKTYDTDGEIYIALGQIALAGLILILHIVEQITYGWQNLSFNQLAIQEINRFQPSNFWFILALSILIISSLFRIYAVRHELMGERMTDILTIVDISSVLLVISSYQLVYDHPAGGSLKSPSLVILYVFIAIRALRFSPRPILISGITAAVGWTFMVVLAVVLDGTEAFTRSYTDHLASFEILISAELEKIAAIVALTGCLAIAARQVRVIIGKAAHGEDYAKALAQSEQNMREATVSHLEAQEALRQLEKSEKLLRTQNERFDAVLKNMSQGVAMFDKNQRLVICNNRYKALYNFPAELTEEGTTLHEILEFRVQNGIYTGDPDAFMQEWGALPESSDPVTKIQKMRDGRTISFVYVPIEHGGWLATHEDISELRKIQEDFYHLAHHDALTGLANRHMFTIQLEQELKRLKKGGSIAVHLIDLDHFKNVNDALGHPVGDKLLKIVTERLQEQAGADGIIARMGGDEFALIQFTGNRPEDSEDLAKRIISAISSPYVIDGHQIVIGASVGIALSPDNGNQIETLMRNADLALYRAKESGRGAHCFFEAEMDAKMQERRVLEIDLREAIETSAFELHYQPLVDLNSEELCGFEALVRWQHPERGLISPAEFIPLAEENGFIVPIGEWVMREACKTAAGWQEHLSISVNLSPVQFRRPGLVQLVMNALATSGLTPRRLELEITESILLEDSASTLATLRQLKGLGVCISMDDFGTGYSSLSYLLSFPFDKIKIDQSFINELAGGGNALNIVRAVAVMAKGMGIQSTAEGVETQQQLDLVRDEGYTQVQGYFVSRPLPADQVEQMLHEKRYTIQETNKQSRKKIVITG